MSVSHAGPLVLQRFTNAPAGAANQRVTTGGKVATVFLQHRLPHGTCAREPRRRVSAYPLCSGTRLAGVAWGRFTCPPIGLTGDGGWAVDRAAQNVAGCDAAFSVRLACNRRTRPPNGIRAAGSAESRARAAAVAHAEEQSESSLASPATSTCACPSPTCMHAASQELGQELGEGRSRPCHATMRDSCSCPPLHQP